MENDEQELVHEQKRGQGGRGGDGLHRHRPGQPWCFAYVGRDGKRHHRSSRTTNQNKAKTARANFLAELRQGEMPDDLAEMRVAEALAMRFDGMDAVGKKTRWQRQLAKPVIAELGGRRLVELGTPALVAYRINRMKTSTVAPVTVNLEVSQLVSLMREAGLERRLRGFKRLKVPRSVKGKVISEQDEDRLLALAEEHPEWAASVYSVCLACNTGLRGGEIRKLRLGQIDVQRKQITITRESTKSDAGARRVPLNPRALWVTGRLLELAANRGSVAPEHFLLAAWVVRDGHGGWDPTRGNSDLRRAWALARKAIGLDARVHDGRHTFVSRAAVAGVAIAVLQAMVGHMSVEMVRHYTHINSPEMRDAVEAINRPLPSILEAKHAIV